MEKAQIVWLYVAKVVPCLLISVIFVRVCACIIKEKDKRERGREVGKR